MLDFFGFIACCVLAQAIRWPLQARRTPKNGSVPAAIRVIAGSHVGLRPGWTHGRITARAGVLTLRRSGPLGMRIAKGKLVDIPVAAVASGKRGQVGIANAWSVNPMLAIREMATPDGRLLVAASAPGLEALERTIAGQMW